MEEGQGKEVGSRPLPLKIKKKNPNWLDNLCFLPKVFLGSVTFLHIMKHSILFSSKYSNIG